MVDVTYNRFEAETCVVYYIVPFKLFYKGFELFNKLVISILVMFVRSMYCRLLPHA